MDTACSIPSPESLRAAPNGSTSGYATAADARVAAFRHLVDLTWSHDSGDEGRIDDVLASARECGCPLNHGDRAKIRADMLERWGWQRRYRAFRAEGYDDCGAHALASGTPKHLVAKVYTAA